MVTGYRTIVAYNHQEEAIIEFNKKSDLFAKQGMIAQICAGSMGPCMNFISNLSYFIVCICGALFIALKIGGPIYDFNGLDVATVIMFLTLTKQFTRPINQIAQLYTGLLNALAGAERVFSILDEETEDFTGKVKVDFDNVEGHISFENIQFGYTPEKLVLKDFSVDIRSGQKIALVGATGSGKTTVVNLLLRFYDINSGIIKIDGVDIMDISKEDLRNLISIVLQDPVLFKDTIENNVRYGKVDATDEEVDAALEFANCNTFINKLPMGKNTLLTEGATNISLGQRQLITIARAVLANPKILILDEATSSVDTRTEKNIQDAIDNHACPPFSFTHTHTCTNIICSPIGNDTHLNRASAILFGLFLSVEY
jgi:ATP-binding cassette subfamily B protein